MMETQTYTARCRLCGGTMPPLHCWFDAPSGIFIYQGKPIRLTPGETVILDFLLKHFGQPVTVRQLEHRYIMSRPAGEPETATKVLYVLMAHLRAKLRKVGLTITTRSSANGYALAPLEVM